MTTDYTKLDAAILAAIKNGAHAGIQFDMGAWTQARVLTAEDNPMPWRLIERRLQALRKAGKIAYDRKTGWRLA